MMKKLFGKWIFLVGLFLFTYQSFATHITGGTLTYQHLGGSTYRITLKLYRDCSPTSFTFDPSIVIEVRGANGATFTPSKDITIALTDSNRLDPYVDTCVVKPNICVQEAIYSKVVTNLPPLAGGYHLFYQRCCRNGTITNLNGPLNQGMTVYTYIPDNNTWLTNTSPSWINFPPTFICQGMPINFNHAATDADGDSLVYSLYNAYQGCDPGDPAGPTCAVNFPTFPGNVATFNSVNYLGGYNGANPLGGGGVNVNPSTGLLNGIPPALGQYVVGVMCREYRNGQLLSYIVRDVQFNVVYCPPLSVANFTASSSCQGANVSFTNTSTSTTGQTTYLWNFGDPTATNDTSNVANPGSYTYPGLGPYTASLIVNPRTGCADTITQTITIAFVNAAYTSVDSLCITNTANFTDGSVPSANSTINSWNWNFGDPGSGANNTSTLQNPSHTFSYPGTYTVSLIVNTTPFGCADTIRKPVKVLGIPLVNANDTISCANIGSVGVLGTILNAPGGTWTSLTGGSFSPNANVLNPNYTPTVADTTAGFATLILTSAGNTMCPGVSDTMRINFYDGPTAIAGNDHYVCADTTSIPLTGSVTVASGGTWTPIFGTTGSVTNPNSLTTAVFFPSPVDIANGMATLLLTTTGNGNCIAAKDTVRIFFANPPAATAALSDTSCVNQPFNVTGTSSTGTGVWYTSGTGAFADSSQANTVYTPSGADALAGTVTIYYASTGNNGCRAAVDSMVVTLLPAPLAIAGNDTSACLNNPTVGLNGQIFLGTGGTWSTPPGGGTFLPNNTVLNPTYVPSSSDTAAGFATIILTGQGLITSCPANNDTLIITFNPGPNAVANATGDTIFVCNDTSSVPLNGSVSNAGGGTWTTSNGSGTITSAGSLSTTYIPSPGDITTNNILLILTTSGNGNCFPDADTVVINFFNNPVVTVAAADDSICVTQTINVTSTSTTGSGYWTSNGTGTFTPFDTLFNVTYVPSLNDTGIVTLYFNSTNNNGCRQQKDSINVNVLPGPLATLGNDTAVCNTNTNVQLIGSTAFSSGYNWSSPGGGTFSSGSILNPVFTPSASDTTQGYAIVVLTPIGLVLNCAPTPDTIRIDLLDPPTAIANASGDTIRVCKDTAFVQLNGTILVATNGVWTTTNGTGVIANPNSPVTIYTPSASDVTQGSVTLVLSTTGTVADCSNDQDTVVISFLNDAVVSATMSNDSICSGSSINLNGSSSTGGGYWTTSGTGYFTPDDSLASTTYVPALSDAPNVSLIYHSLFNFGCREITDTVLLNVVPGPTAAFTSTSGCLGQPINYFDASTPAGLVNSWQWTLGSGQTSTLQNPTDTISTLTTQTVTLVVGTALGCTDTVVQTVNVNNPPNADFTVDDWILAMNQQANFTNLTPNTTAWTWFFGDNSGTSNLENPSYSYPIGGIYPVTFIVTDLNGCMDTVIKEVTVVLPPVVPTGFSPNGDGSNDIFYPRGGPFTKMHMRIYNNWGELIFETHELKGGWDGTYKDVPQPLGVYVWVVDAENENGDTFHDSGDVTLLR